MCHNVYFGATLQGGIVLWQGNRYTHPHTGATWLDVTRNSVNWYHNSNTLFYLDKGMLSYYGNMYSFIKRNSQLYIWGNGLARKPVTVRTVICKMAQNEQL